MDVIVRALRRCRSGELADAIALHNLNGSDCTYKQLLHGADALRAGIQKFVRSTIDSHYGPRIACLADPGPSYVLSMWCTWMSKGIFVPLAPSHPPAVLEHAINDSGASVILVDRKYSSLLEGIRKNHKISMHVVDEMLDTTGLPADISRIDDDAFSDHSKHNRDSGSVILYTSGTTGQPKGVLHTHRSIKAQMQSLTEAWQWQPDDRILHTLPLHHIHGLVNGLLCAQYASASVQFAPFNAPHVWRSLTRGEASVFMGVPTMYSHLLKVYSKMPAEQQAACRTAAAELRLTICGSSACPITVLEEWRALAGSDLLERYGMTEIGMALSNPYRGVREAGTVGQPLPGVSVRIEPVSQHADLATSQSQTSGDSFASREHWYSDDSSSDEEDDRFHSSSSSKSFRVDAEQRETHAVVGEAAGELRIKGESVFKEYWNRPDATAAAFDTDGYFCTGDTVDTVQVGDQTYYRILGRTSVDIIKSGGFKMSALRIENVLMEHPQVKSVAVMGMADEVYGEKVACVCEQEPGSDLKFSELLSWASDRLPVYELPRDMLMVDTMPRNSMGKVNKVELRKLFAKELGEVNT